MMNKNRLLLLLVALVLNMGSVQALSEQAQSKGFVELSAIDPTIKVSLRYFTSENFKK